MKSTSTVLTVLALSAAAASAATTIQVKFEAVNNVGFAPVAGFFHDNTGFDVFSSGGVASSALETLAEVGNPGPLLATAGPGIDKGTNGAPFGPGSTVMFNVSVADGNGFFTYAAMLLPTNDYFIGNDSARNIASLLGAAAGTAVSFDVVNFWDAGTEPEDFATSAGNPLFAGLPPDNGAAGATENGVIGLVPRTSNPFATFANIPGDFNVASLNPGDGAVGRFTLTVIPTTPQPVPEGGSAVVLFGLGLAGAAAVRRRSL